ncbi:MAG: phosphoglycerate dehydrogenase [Propionivibrio sp.]
MSGPLSVLLTTTSFQDTPGAHHDLLAQSGFEVIRARGPLNETQMLDLVQRNGGFDAFLNGDDRISARVIDAAGPRLRVIAKYGIGLDSIDVAHATEKRIPVLFTPGVNHTTVAEHTFGLMIALAKDFWGHASAVKSGRWVRRTGHELMGKTLGVLGLGRIGQEVVKRAAAFGMHCVACSRHWPDEFASRYGVTRASSAEELLRVADVVTLHMGLSEANRGFINARTLAMMKKGAYLINTARGGLVVEEDVAEACRQGHLAGYGTDVLDEEPPRVDHPFLSIDSILVTPHIGSRTFESVERQALRAVSNLVEYLAGGKDYIQANPF